MNATNIQEYYNNSSLRHPYYTSSVSKYNDLHDHYIDKPNMEVITRQRPNEDDKIKKYREEIAVPVTKRILWKVISLLDSIRKSDQWNVDYNEKFYNSKIAPDQTLKVYLETKIPVYNSLTNWMFNGLLPQYCLDANAVVVTMPPLFEKVEANQYANPFPVIYNADQIIDYKMNQYYVLQSDEAYFYDNGGVKAPGKVVYTIEPDTIARYVQTSSGNEFREDARIANTTGRLPVRHLYGVLMNNNGENILSDSRLSPMVPFLVEAMRFYNSYQSETTQHAHSTFWTKATQSCPAGCQAGKVSTTKDGKAVWIICKSCKGEGSLIPGPFETIRLKPDQAGTYPTGDPAGYITKNVEIAKLLLSSYESSCYEALCAVNCQDSDDVPANNSGIAKAYDREDRATLYSSVAEDMVRVTDGVIEDISDWRYSVVVPNKTERDKALPIIHVPDKFDIATTTQRLADIQALTSSKADPEIVHSMMIELSNKINSSDPDKAARIRASLELNPLRGRSAEDIGYLKSLGLVSEEDAIIAANINTLLELAIEQDAKFLTGKYSDKINKLRELAKTLKAEEEKPPVGNAIPGNDDADDDSDAGNVAGE